MSDARRTLSGSQVAGRHFRYVAPADPGDSFECAVMLRRPPGAELPSLELMCAEPIRDDKQRERFRRENCARREDGEAVCAFVERFGLRVLDCDLDQRLVLLQGTSECYSRAFGVEIMLAEGPAQGRHRSYRGTVAVPESVADVVVGVFGLDQRRFARAATGSSMAAHPVPMRPSYLADLYRYPKGDGAGQSVAIVQLGGGYIPGTMEDYFRRMGLPLPAVSNVGLLGSGNDPGRNIRYDAEVCLDFQIFASLAPAARFTNYFAPNTGLGFLLALRAAVYGGHSVVSISWSESEEELTPMIVRAMEQTLHEAAALGVTVCVASGDLGTGGELFHSLPEPFFPATSPFALAVGGTSPLFHAGHYYGEVAWDEGQLASGGGVSALFDVPPYQRRAGIVPRSIRPGVGHGRGMPDVSAMSYGFDTWQRATVGYWVNVNGTWQALGGTSASTPAWAALITRLNDHLGFPIGFLQPYLYRIRREEGAFFDVQLGDNANTFSLLGGYPARRGWDACTGLGRPDGRSLLAAIQRQLSP